MPDGNQLAAAFQLPLFRQLLLADDTDAGGVPGYAPGRKAEEEEAEAEFFLQFEAGEAPGGGLQLLAGEHLAVGDVDAEGE